MQRIAEPAVLHHGGVGRRGSIPAWGQDEAHLVGLGVGGCFGRQSGAGGDSWADRGTVRTRAGGALAQSAGDGDSVGGGVGGVVGGESGKRGGIGGATPREKISLSGAGSKGGDRDLGVAADFGGLGPCVVCASAERGAGKSVGLGPGSGARGGSGRGGEGFAPDGGHLCAGPGGNGVVS